MPIYDLNQTPDFHPDVDSPPILDPLPLHGGRLAVPLHWGKIWGIDFGIGEKHPFAAVLCAWDRDCDVFYVLKTVKIVGAIPDAHAAAIRRIDSNAPIAWPHDGNNRDRGSGETLASQYRALNLRMMSTHATFPDGGYSTEAAVLEMDQRMRTGRFRVCEDLHDWWFEYRLYHREKGMIVKADDDLLSATQKAIMMKRFAKVGPVGYVPFKQRGTQPRTAAEFDLFTGLPL